MTNKFDNYIGEVILVDETTSIRNSKHSGEYEHTAYKLSKEDKILNNICNEIKADGLSVRIWYPNTVGTMDIRNDRINIQIEKKDDKYTISKIFTG